MKYTKAFEKYWSKVLYAGDYHLDFGFKDGKTEHLKRTVFRAWKAGIKYEKGRW